MTDSSAPQLNPTLWRTCRVLAGRTRLALLQAVLTGPDRSVSELARSLDISEPRASQELRRLQSRGLLKRCPLRNHVVYLPCTDPQVPTAAPLLGILRRTMATAPGRVEDLIQVAKGPAHERRIRLIRLLMNADHTFSNLLSSAGLNPAALRRHLAVLSQTGWIRRKGKSIRYAHPTHPLARVLSKLIHSSG